MAVGPNEFYLGVRTGAGFGGNPVPPNRTAYGRVHLRPVNGVLSMVENVMSYNSRGVIVGTTSVVPEPFGACINRIGDIVARRVPVKTGGEGRAARNSGMNDLREAGAR